MATYAIGDVQGCADPLERLLDRFRFDPAADHLWFVGDLVNRGPDSAGVLRLVKSLGDRATVVLGNHDLHMLAAALGHDRARKGDTFQDVLVAPDRDELLLWLRNRPLFHVEGSLAMVHAGLLPQWTIATAERLAREFEQVLRGADHDRFFRHMYGNAPDRWDDRLADLDRWRTIVNAMTRMRICSPAGVMEFRHKGELDDIPEGYMPWFDAPLRQSRTHTVVFGHWSALGVARGADYLALDSGCVWGRTLTAARLEDGRIFDVPCAA